ncbi:MAG: TAXI family TRAP transporter solute-binding subunit [Synergistaceae bacterium]|nr:TAXI family TRAP transporter solute-binding subunit [Synergistaceae bacterium]
MRRGLRILVLAMVMAGLVAGAASAVTFINIATGSTGGAYYPLGAAMAKIWNDNIEGIKASAQSTGGTVNNIQLMGSGEAETGFMDGLYYYAYLGKDKFEGNPQAYIRALVPLYPEPTQLMIAKGSGIKTLHDFKGKRISIGAVASGTEVTARQLLRLAGIDPDKDIQAENLGVGDTATAFSDKRIDAAVMVGSLGMAGVVEAATLGVVEFIDVPDNIRDKVIAETPYWVPFTIPANFYSNQPNEVKTYASWNILAINKDVDGDLAYRMTKALFEHKDDLLAVRAMMETMKPENIQYILIPMHYGARRYYDEVM